MKDIINYYQVNPNLATSGQPTATQFQLIAQNNYQVMINLALPSSDNALADEGAIVTELGLIYIHIPVVWESPRVEEVKLFYDLMTIFKDRKVWVHCAKNMRVSCFIYLWQKHLLKLPEEQASYSMKEIWQPQGVWQKLIEETALIFE